jgi:malonyl CoA-acyl carrier protein transacylase
LAVATRFVQLLSYHFFQSMIHAVGMASAMAHHSAGVTKALALKASWLVTLFAVVQLGGRAPVATSVVADISELTARLHST